MSLKQGKAARSLSRCVGDCRLPSSSPEGLVPRIRVVVVRRAAVAMPDSGRVLIVGGYVFRVSMSGGWNNEVQEITTGLDPMRSNRSSSVGC